MLHCKPGRRSTSPSAIARRKRSGSKARCVSSSSTMARRFVSSERCNSRCKSPGGYRRRKSSGIGKRMSKKRAAIKKRISMKKLEATKIISDKNFNPLAPATIAQKIKKSPSKKVLKVIKALSPAKGAKVMKKLPLKKIKSLEKSLSPRRLRPRK